MGHGGLDRYRGFLDAAAFERLRQAVQRPLPAAIRLNTLKITVDDALHAWPERYGWQVQPVPFCPAGWQVDGTDLAKTLEHRMGFYYIQDAASMLPAELFDFPTEGAPLMLDLAAAPGGKTTHLVCRTGDRGVILANDANARRIPILRAKLQDWGALCTAVTQYPGEQFGAWFPETFDRVLLDAPCSGEGLRTAERRRTRPIPAAERQALQHRQIALLDSAFQALKPGGELVYATCSLAPEEDEAVLDALLARYPHQATVETVDHLLPVPAPALDSDGERAFHPQVGRAVRLWPHLVDTAGFFAALVRKRDAVPTEPQPHPTRAPADAGLVELTGREAIDLFDGLLQGYGFDFAPVAERHGLALWRRGGAVYAIPELFLSHFADLPHAAAGMQIGELEDGAFAPSHELAARFGPQLTRRRLALADDQTAVWLAGRDLRGVGTPYATGTVVLLEDEGHRFLGRGKVLPGRIRNLLPRRLVY